MTGASVQGYLAIADRSTEHIHFMVPANRELVILQLWGSCSKNDGPLLRLMIMNPGANSVWREVSHIELFENIFAFNWPGNVRIPAGTNIKLVVSAPTAAKLSCGWTGTLNSATVQ